MPDIDIIRADADMSEAELLEAAADQALATSNGDARNAIKALIAAKHFLESELEKLRSAVSTGYARGKDRKDWYD